MQNCQIATRDKRDQKVQNCLLLVKVTLPAIGFMLLCNLCMTLTMSDLKGMLEVERKTVASIEHIN